ncbi:hypothetical protein D3C81_1883730 [compost metagenome]
MPDKEAASWASFVRSVRKIMAKAKEVPPPMPRKMIHSGMSVLPPRSRYSPPNEASINTAMIATKRRWFFIRPARIGTRKVTGNWDSCSREIIQPALLSLNPRLTSKSGNHEMVT